MARSLRSAPSLFSGVIFELSGEEATDPRAASDSPTATDDWATPAHPLTTTADVTQRPRLGGAAAGWEFQSSAADVGVRLAVWDHPGAGTDAWYVNRIVGFLGPGRHQLLVEDPRCQRAHAPEGLQRSTSTSSTSSTSIGRPSPLRPPATRPVVVVLPPMEAAVPW